LLFIGAGVGADIYPLWNQLLGELLEAAGLKLTEEQRNWSPPAIAEYIKAQNAEAYKDVVRTHFQSYKPIVERSIQHIKNLPVNGIITTNYDDALDEATREKGFTSVTLAELHPDIFNEEVKCVFHIHGFIDSENDDGDFEIILSQDEYLKYYKEKSIVSNFLRRALQNFNILFIGFSLVDPFVMEIIKEINSMEEHSVGHKLPYPRMSRYALCELEIKNSESGRKIDWNAIEERESYLNEFGISPIWYEKGNQYRGLNKLIEGMADKLKSSSEGIAERIPEKP